MLSPDARTVAFDLLRPPPGHRLDLAVLTTYTLDLEALLALPLGVLAHADGGMEDMLADPLLLTQALREAGDRIHVFVDETGIAIPGKGRELYAMLESSVHPVRAPNGGVFHPKVWVARFMAHDEPPLLRVAILSRNLTFDRSWDVALASEASPMGRRRARPSRPLSDLLQKLPGLATVELEPRVAERISALAEETGRTRFPSPEGFVAPVEFHLFGLSRRQRPWCPLTGGSRVLAIAPFVNRTALDALIGAGKEERRLVSRQEELDKLPDDTLDAWEQIFVLSDAAQEEPEDGAGTSPTGLHAKVIAVERGWDVTWFVGSANLTAAAFTGNNVEMMASVTGRRGRRTSNRGYGIDRFLESGFEGLCTPYRKNNREPDGDDVVQARQRIEKARDALIAAEPTVVCSCADESWTWTLKGRIMLPDGVEAVAWPISVPEDQAHPLDLPPSWTLPLTRLTAFAAFRLRVPVQGVDDIRMTLRLPASGMPDDRLHQVLRILIDTPDRFLRFLRALLGGLDGMVGWAMSGGDGSGGGPWGEGFAGETLLEDLVRAAARDPERLKPVHRLIDDLRKTEEGRKIVPDDLFAVWSAVEETLREGNPS